MLIPLACYFVGMAAGMLAGWVLWGGRRGIERPLYARQSDLKQISDEEFDAMHIQPSKPWPKGHEKEDSDDTP